MDRWDRLANALRAYQTSQQEAWGDLDDYTLARYLEGVGTDEERRSVEQAMARFPALGELVHVVQNVLAAPTTEHEPIPAPPAVAVDAGRCWRPAGTILELVDRLAAWVDQAGRTAAAGLREAFSEPRVAVAGTMSAGAETAQDARWEIPLLGLEARLVLALRPGASRGQWVLRLQILAPREFAVPSQARLEILRPNGRRAVSGRLVDHLDEPIHLTDGQWQVAVEFGEQTFRIPLQTGEP